MAVNFDGSNGGGSGPVTSQDIRVIHSESQIVYPKAIKIGDFIYVYGPKGSERKLTRVVDEISSGIVVEWISGIALFTELLMFVDYAILPRDDGSYAEEQWVETAPTSFKVKTWWLRQLLAKPFKPEDYPRDYHP